MQFSSYYPKKLIFKLLKWPRAFNSWLNFSTPLPVIPVQLFQTVGNLFALQLYLSKSRLRCCKSRSFFKFLPSFSTPLSVISLLSIIKILKGLFKQKTFQNSEKPLANSWELSSLDWAFEHFSRLHKNSFHQIRNFVSS